MRDIEEGLFYVQSNASDQEEDVENRPDCHLVSEGLGRQNVSLTQNEEAKGVVVFGGVSTKRVDDSKSRNHHGTVSTIEEALVMLALAIA